MPSILRTLCAKFVCAGNVRPIKNPVANLYFDESIRDNGRFIIGALVGSKKDLSGVVRSRWRDNGHDPDIFEYKSSSLKANNLESQQQRDAIQEILFGAKLALTVCPCDDRRNLGKHCASLISQLQSEGLLSRNEHQLFLDQNISMPKKLLDALKKDGIYVHLNQDSRVAAGLQVADHAAHALGGMLLEGMGIIKKTVLAGENSGYDPALEIELGFELWAGLRYALIGKNEYIPGVSPPPEDPINPYFRVDGCGLFIAPSCSESLAGYARNVFGINYLGCIH